MSTNTSPVKGATLAKGNEAQAIDLGEGGVIKPIITKGGHGSSVLLGTFVLKPGQVGHFDLPHPSGMREEIYYIVSGKLLVGTGDDSFVAEPGDAIFFEPGHSYEIKPATDEDVDIIWTGQPPSR